MDERRAAQVSQEAGEPAPSQARLPRNVRALGLVSLANDTASDMVIPLLPAFVTSVLGLGPAFLGTLEGIAESTAALLKLYAGWHSDRIRRRKSFALVGYSISNAARPLIGLATSGVHVLLCRFADRAGKGIRTSPRDALLAAAVVPGQRGKAFGYQRALDNLGAAIGPLLAALLLWAFPGQLRLVFLLSAIPGVAAVGILAVMVREKRAQLQALGPSEASKSPRSATPAAAYESSARARQGRSTSPLSGGLPTGTFRVYLLAVLLFTLGNSSDVFLALRAQDLGVPLPLIPVIWTVLSVMRAGTATPGGQLSDRIGRRPAILAGWLVYAATYLGFALARVSWHAWALFAIYGLYYGLVEGPERALVADLVPEEQRGRAYGWFHLCVGIGALPASLLFGLLWRAAGAPWAFGLGAVLAAVAALVLLGLRIPQGPPAQAGSGASIRT